MTLEEKIKALMEQKNQETLDESSIENLDEKETITTKSGTTITDDDNDDSKDDSEDDQKDSDDDQNDEGDDSDKDTDVEKDQGKKNDVKVNEEKDPFGKLDSADKEETGATKTSKLKTGLNKKDPAPGKLDGPPSSGATDDNGDNARLKAKAGQKDSAGKVSDGVTGSGVDDANAKNNSGTELQKGADKNPVGVKEHMDAMFSGEELSEDFKAKATTIFEAAVKAQAAAEVEALTEEYAQKVIALQEEIEEQINEAVEEVKSELGEQIDGFLNYVVEQWVEDNQVALESGIKVEIVNGFIDGLKDLFKEHYVDIPEERFDVVEEQETEIAALTDANVKLEESNDALKKELVSLQSALVFEDVTTTLTEVQRDKFEDLVKTVEFTTKEEYAEKLKTMKESYFPEGKAIQHSEPKKDDQQSSTVMDQYVAAIGQKLKF